MMLDVRRWVGLREVLGVGVALSVVALSGCASPGPPRSPTLNLPGEVTKLTAVRRGTQVELTFGLPQKNTDKLPLKGERVTASFCRAVDAGKCLPVAGVKPVEFALLTDGHATIAELHDALPAELSSGTARVLAYRVELFNAAGHTARFSDPVYALAGTAPSAVEGLAAQGSRLGIVVSWKPVAGDGSVVALRREELAPKPKVVKKTEPVGKAGPVKTVPVKSGDEAGVVWLGVGDEKADAGMVLDATAEADEPYRYVAERRKTVQLGGRTLEMRSEASTAVVYVLHDVYPPPVPTDLSGAAFADADGKTAVDLIWQPVVDAGLSGYNVYREGKKLNGEPVRLPAFHDVVPGAGHYRYRVTAVDEKGNESAGVVTVVEAGGP
jgi:hypothetical protein